MLSHTMPSPEKVQSTHKDCHPERRRRFLPPKSKDLRLFSPRYTFSGTDLLQFAAVLFALLLPAAAHATAVASTVVFTITSPTTMYFARASTATPTSPPPTAARPPGPSPSTTAQPTSARFPFHLCPVARLPPEPALPSASIP